MVELTREQLKAVFAKKKFAQLPLELREDILDAVSPSGESTDATDWNSFTEKERGEFLEQFKTDELKKLKTQHIKEDIENNLKMRIAKLLKMNESSINKVVINTGKRRTNADIDFDFGILVSDLNRLKEHGLEPLTIEHDKKMKGVRINVTIQKPKELGIE